MRFKDTMKEVVDNEKTNDPHEGKSNAEKLKEFQGKVAELLIEYKLPLLTSVPKNEKSDKFTVRHRASTLERTSGIVIKSDIFQSNSSVHRAMVELFLPAIQLIYTDRSKTRQALGDEIVESYDRIIASLMDKKRMDIAIRDINEIIERGNMKIIPKGEMDNQVKKVIGKLPVDLQPEVKKRTQQLKRGEKSIDDLNFMRSEKEINWQLK